MILVNPWRVEMNCDSGVAVQSFATATDDDGASTFTQYANEEESNGSAWVTVVATPASGSRRVDWIEIVNTDSVTRVVGVRMNNGSITRAEKRFSIGPYKAIYWTPTLGWQAPSTASVQGAEAWETLLIAARGSDRCNPALAMLQMPDGDLPLQRWRAPHGRVRVHDRSSHVGYGCNGPRSRAHRRRTLLRGLLGQRHGYDGWRRMRRRHDRSDDGTDRNSTGVSSGKTRAVGGQHESVRLPVRSHHGRVAGDGARPGSPGGVDRRRAHVLSGELTMRASLITLALLAGCPTPPACVATSMRCYEERAEVCSGEGQWQIIADCASLESATCAEVVDDGHTLNACVPTAGGER